MQGGFHLLHFITALSPNTPFGSLQQKKSHPEHLETYVLLAIFPGDHCLDLHVQIMCTVEIGLEGNQRAVPTFKLQE